MKLPGGEEAYSSALDDFSAYIRPVCVVYSAIGQPRRIGKACTVLVVSEISLANNVIRSIPALALGLWLYSPEKLLKKNQGGINGKYS